MKMFISLAHYTYPNVTNVFSLLVCRGGSGEQFVKLLAARG